MQKIEKTEKKKNRFVNGVIELCLTVCIVITWYLMFGAIVVGFMVAYAAMFGFDKLKQALEGGKWTK